MKKIEATQLPKCVLGQPQTKINTKTITRNADKYGTIQYHQLTIFYEYTTSWSTLISGYSSNVVQYTITKQQTFSNNDHILITFKF